MCILPTISSEDWVFLPYLWSMSIQYTGSTTDSIMAYVTIVLLLVLLLVGIYINSINSSNVNYIGTIIRFIVIN